MKKIIIILITGCTLLLSCDIMVNNSDDDNHQRFYLKTSVFFPFENNLNRWHYTESTGNTLDIKVIDTISDDYVNYYRVAFGENRVDTTDDWFRRSSGNVMFGSSLSGVYRQFLPGVIDSVNGSYVCGENRVKYSYRDSVVISGKVFRKIIILNFNVPVIHGFEQIVLAESIGIIQMTDNNGRWPICYSIDSCLINGAGKQY